MGLEYSIETLNLNVYNRKRSSLNSSKRNSYSNSYEMIQPASGGLEESKNSVAATVLDSVIFGKTAPGELTRDIYHACGINRVKLFKSRKSIKFRVEWLDVLSIWSKLPGALLF